MKTENKKAIEEFLSHSEDIGDDLLDLYGETFGVVPFIFRVMRERPESFALSSVADYKTFRPSSLDAKTAELITVAAAVGANASNCLKLHINTAVKEGATQEEILDTILLACLIGKTKLLASSLRTYKDIFGEESPEKSQKQ